MTTRIRKKKVRTAIAKDADALKLELAAAKKSGAPVQTLEIQLAVAVKKLARERFEKSFGLLGTRAITAIQQMGKHTNPRKNFYTIDDVAKVTQSLRAPIDALEAKMTMQLSREFQQVERCSIMTFDPLPA